MGWFWKSTKISSNFCHSISCCVIIIVTENKEAFAQALLSIDKMIDGGIYDQVGGGFARYSTDTEWLVPHFEKMLYDNALLISVIK